MLRTTRPLQTLRIEFIAGLFWGLALAVVIFLFVSIYTTAGVIDSETGRVSIWGFLTNLGIIRPLLILGASILLARLAWHLHLRKIGAARWSRLVLVWLILIAGVGIVQAFYVGLNAETASGEPAGQDFIRTALPWIVAEIIFAVGYLILIRSMYLYKGDEDVVQQRTRMAWNLLVPTILVFWVVGIGPLEQVFITSLTNERFASSEPVEFIGLDNYRELLGLRVDRIPCDKDENEKCLIISNEEGESEISYSRLRDYLGDAYRDYRRQYDEVRSVDLFSERYVLGARDPEFVTAFVGSVVYTAVAITIQVVVGLFMAIVLTARIRGMGVMRVAMLVPLAIPTLIATQFWDVMLTPDQSGVLNDVLMSLGVVKEPIRWLLDSNWQLPSVIFVIVWKETPGMAILLLPGLLNISPEIYQAASVDGASRAQQFFLITLPLLRPTIGVALVLRTMVMLRVFDVFEILLGARRFSLATYAHDVLLQRQQLGYSSTISVAIFVIILAFTIIYMRSLRIDEA
jgi:trehalose/maltose transport system permease protein